MDFDLSKENIQPLRGGRNAQQLEMALQAQTQQEYQRQLLAQKEDFENQIRNYQGDDPLEPYYQYIAWIEQSYPKSGHEGNCQKLLEHCLCQFENDARYTNDRRFCKLWIKYIDHFTNPIELYSMMRAKNLCTGCADFYKAWAYYYEVAGDFQKANNVLEEGKKNLAQPYDELIIAQKNLFTAAGETMINGPNQNKLIERREALTSLYSFRSGRVGSVRIPSSHPQTIVGHQSQGGHFNAAVNVYEDQAGPSRQNAVPPESIVGTVKCQEVPKENKLAAGTWHSGNYNSGYKSKSKTPSFTILEEDAPSLRCLCPNMPTHDCEDFSWFKRVPLTYPEEILPHQIRMYPKERVYSDLGTEYCLEEIAYGISLQQQRQEEQAITTISLDSDDELIQDDENDVAEIHTSTRPQPKFEVFSEDHQNFLEDVFNRSNEPVLANEPNASMRRISQPAPPKFQILEDPAAHQVDTSKQRVANKSLNNSRNKPVVSSNISPAVKFVILNTNDHVIYKGTSPNGTPQKGFANVSVVHQAPTKFEILEDDDPQMCGIISNNGISTSKVQVLKPATWISPQVNHKSNNNLSPSQQNNNMRQSDSPPVAFGFSWTPPSNSNIPEQQDESAMIVVQPKSIKSNAFRELAVDELVETGSRHGGAMAAQPTDGAKNIEDDDMDGGGDYMDNTISTQQFNFNLNAMKVSTPQNKNKPQDGIGDPQNSRRNLFSETAKTSKEPKALSTIMEETKSGYGSSSSSSSATTKSNMSGHHKMSTISEEHTGYLAQNSMANAELRRSLLGNLIDDDLPASPKVRTPAPKIRSPASVVRSPASVVRSPASVVRASAPVVPKQQTPKQLQPKPPQYLDLPPPRDETLPLPQANGEPLTTAPNDPFGAGLLETLLERVNFPGVHRDGFVPIEGCPKLCIKQDPLYISSDQYVIEKLLGKGQFGTVYKAFDCRRQSYVALKLQRPPNKWEFYICRELAARLQNHDLKDRFMNINMGYFSSQCSILVSKYEPFGSLLNLVNVLKVNGTRTKEPLCFYMTLEMLSIVKAMHEAKIIHADIKPDNFLVVLQNDNTLKLQLIDFGCSIDMSLFPDGTTFRQEITTENFVCCEVLDRRPWSYHTDLFCIAASAHVLLFNDYIQMKKVGDSWSISARLPRYCKIDLWNMFFSSLLNQQAGPADIATLELLFREEVEGGSCKKDLPSQIRHVVNLLKKR